MTVITLLTDFGLTDGYPGVMKGVILKISPDVKLVDLSHEVSPQDIMGGAMLLWRSARYFPDGTIHVAVVDPGVGTSRRAIAAHIGTQYFVGPDNGLFSLMLDEAENKHRTIWIGELDRSAYWLSSVSTTFHGRDIFAPVAAHLANGVSLEKMSNRINDPVRIKPQNPVKTSFGWMGRVTHIDHFGNLSTNIESSLLGNLLPLTIGIKGRQIDGLVKSFGEKPAGSLVALIDSSGMLAISVVNGNAAQLLSAALDDEVELRMSR